MKTLVTTDLKIASLKPVSFEYIDLYIGVFSLSIARLLIFSKSL